VNLLDTDVLSHLQKNDSVGASIAARLSASPDRNPRITTVSAYEMLGGAIDLIRDLRRKHKDLIPGFDLLQELFDYLGSWQGRILPYDHIADRLHQGLPPRIRQGLGNDARIAAVALVYGAAVWTCNVDDFKRVPGLIVYRAETGVRII
jgi:predicted nucleic acid-binding protein